MRLMDLPVTLVLLSLANKKWNVMCLNLYFIVFNLLPIFGKDRESMSFYQALPFVLWLWTLASLVFEETLHVKYVVNRWEHVFWV